MNNFQRTIVKHKHFLLWFLGKFYMDLKMIIFVKQSWTIHIQVVYWFQNAILLQIWIWWTSGPITAQNAQIHQTFHTIDLSNKVAYY